MFRENISLFLYCHFLAFYEIRDKDRIQEVKLHDTGPDGARWGYCIVKGELFMLAFIKKEKKVFKAQSIKSSSSDIVETPAKFYVRGLSLAAQSHHFGGMAFVNSTKLKTKLCRRGGQAAAPCGFVCVSLSNV